MEKFRGDEIDGEKGLKAAAVTEIEGLDPSKLKYEILFTDKADIGFENMQKIRSLIYGNRGSENARS